MVSSLRTWNLPYRADRHVDGLFVLNKSNARHLPIPHLPVIVAHGKGTYRVLNHAGRDGDDEDVPRIFLDDVGAFDDGDIVWLDSRRQLVKSVLSTRANANTVLVTEQCDNRCTFCSQPPNDRPDNQLYLNAALAILNFDAVGYVGISGGEPTLNRRAFISLLRTLNDFGNRSKLHILSNGRSFADESFTQKVVELVAKRPLLWGIPLYGHESSVHDPLVGADGAFIETVNGLLNLCGYGQSIELRIVPSKQNIYNLRDIVQFVVSSFSSVRIISIMNLEPKGWGRANYGSLYVNVRDQSSSLRSAVSVACTANREVRLFNYPLCLLPNELRRFAVKSISDWKNYYPDECSGCRILEECGGFFASATGKFREVVEVQL
jgi:His-Xaa-Ser system radical SAM maturase HxsC